MSDRSGGNARVAELEEVFRGTQVLEPVQPEVETGVDVQGLTGRLGQHDLPAVGRGADPGGSVDVDADVALAGHDRRPGVDTDPDPDGFVERLDLLGGTDRVVRPAEGDEERVALRVDLDPVVTGERGAQDAPMRGEQVGVVIAMLVEETRRTLDVGEQEGHGAGREVSHLVMMDGQAVLGDRPDRRPRPTTSPTTSVVARKALKT